MKLLVLYFSGTGNTDYVARYLVERLSCLAVGTGRQPSAPAAGIEIELRSVEQQRTESLPDFDVLLLGFPVYGCDSPPFLQSYLAKLKPGGGRGVIVFCTKAMYDGHAVRRNLQRLATKGYVPLGEGSITMPGTDGLAFIGKESGMARKAREKDYEHLEQADRLAGRIAGVVTEVGAGRPTESLRVPTQAGISGAFDWAWGMLYDVVGSYFLRHRFRSDERCVGCGLCARICPVENIDMADNCPEFGDRCALCMRCIHSCPEEAIQIGRWTVDKFRWRGGPKGTFKPASLRPHPGMEPVRLYPG